MEFQDFRAPELQASQALTISHLISPEHQTGKLLHGTSLKLRGSISSELQKFFLYHILFILNVELVNS
jgi:hypothetical protein